MKSSWFLPTRIVMKQMSSHGFHLGLESKNIGSYGLGLLKAQLVGLLLKSSNDINNKAINKRPMPISETFRHINTPIIGYTLEKSQNTTNN